MFSSRRYRHHIEPPRLNLTAMVDVFTVLLIFLLKSYASEGGMLVTTQHLQLPSSTSDLKPEVTLTITVTTEGIFVEDQQVEGTSQALEGDDLFLPLLGRSLTDHAVRFGLGNGAKGRITIIGDRRIPFRLLKRVMYTASNQGFDEISLAVLHREVVGPGRPE